MRPCVCLKPARIADDQAETVLLRLSRASGIDGLSGMAAGSKLLGGAAGIGTATAVSAELVVESQRSSSGRLPGESVSQESVRLLRPLLWASKAELQLLLHEAGISWVEDPTNADTSFMRNFIRHLPGMQPLGAQGALRTAERSDDEELPAGHAGGWGSDPADEADSSRVVASMPRTQGDGIAADLLRVAAACSDASHTWLRAAADVLEACVRPLPGSGCRSVSTGCQLDVAVLSKAPLPVIRRALTAVMQVMPCRNTCTRREPATLRRIVNFGKCANARHRLGTT